MISPHISFSVIAGILLLAMPTARAQSMWWSAAPPVIVPLNQSFYCEATGEDGVFQMTAYKNGAYFAYAELEEEQTIMTCGSYTSVSANGTTILMEGITSGSTLLLSVVVNEAIPPSTPTSVSASNQTAVSLTLSWSASTDNVAVTGYEVKYDSTSLGTATGTSRNVSGLLPNIAYAFSVRARDEVGNWSAWSTPLSVTLVDTTAPTTPGSFATTGHTSSSVSLSWTASTDNVGVVAYDIYRTRAGVAILLASVSGSTLAYSDTHVIAAAAYGYHIKARDSSNNSSTATSTVSVTTSAVTDANGNQIPDSLETLFGNGSAPATDTALNLNVHRPHP